MKLDRKTRKKLYAAKGKPVLIDWPEDAPEAIRGHSYPVYSESGERVFRITVEAQNGSEVKVRIDNDPHRPMIGLKGTRNESGDYESEPERVSEAYEAQLAMEGEAKTSLLGAEHRLKARESRQEAKRKEAIARGHTKTVRTLERLRRNGNG